MNSKENHLIEQITEFKNFKIKHLENHHKEIVNEISKLCREKRKILEGWKSDLDRSYWQTDYAINFVSHLLSIPVSDEKILLTRKMLYPQLKRLQRANNSVGLTPAEMELNSTLDNISKAIKSVKTPAVSNNTITAPDFSALLDEDISTTSDWMNQKPSRPTSMVSSSTLLKTEGGGQVKVEGGTWCAVCREGHSLRLCQVSQVLPPLLLHPATHLRAGGRMGLSDVCLSW